MAAQEKDHNKQISLTVPLEVAHRVMFLRRAGKGDELGKQLLPHLEQMLARMEDKYRIPENAWKEQRPCSACGGLMVRRKVNKNGGQFHFLGCVSYPQCKHTESLK